VEFYSGDLNKLVEEILAPRYRNIWLVGGAMLCQKFLSLGLVDEIRLSIAPFSPKVLKGVANTGEGTSACRE
jgi:riboflavin biosynthesis pyrimidine reductase